ncbi:XdhC family protein [Streptomyces sp. V3I7]|uniref:XdhC family protein n=1 Tax=Streptomyces sp. V3I7 TaxID=3042278 RepID=UPI002787DAF7|nr:XdhC family protein [Streptomyces sp. V3I7]MDQ0994407.1 xanthine dehydrogenase accessory factor [Streptomyces sp. V3I7]
MRELADAARRWAAEGRPGVLARPITETGFGPRNLGEAVLIDADGHCHGSLYRGTFDDYLAAQAAALPEGDTACVREVAVHEEEVKRAGLTCGGQADVLLQPLHTLPTAWWDLLADGSDAALVTRLDASGTRAASTVVTSAPRQDDAGTDVSAEVVERARELLARRRTGRDLQPTHGGLVLIETFPALPHLVIVGEGELAGLLVAQAALLGWPAVVTSEAQEAVRLLSERPGGACLIMLSHDPEVDVPVLSSALTTGVAYVGALGSRRTQARRAASLTEAGFDEVQLGRVHGPIGLDLGARTAAETALAICAEVLAALDGREARVLREGSGSINA